MAAATRTRAPEDIHTWAARLAATLPPLTEAEAANVGRLAAALDRRRARGGAR